jgi:hypothetical protein
MFELLADDSFRRKAQPVAIETQRPLQIIHTERDERDHRLHGNSSADSGV